MSNEPHRWNTLNDVLTEAGMEMESRRASFGATEPKEEVNDAAAKAMEES